MKYQMFLVAAVACLLFTVTQSKPTHVCEPGSQFKVQCNDCRCNLEGTDMLCTRKLCPEFENMVEESSDKESKHEEKPVVEESDKQTEEKPGSEDCEKTHTESPVAGDSKDTPASGDSHSTDGATSDAEGTHDTHEETPAAGESPKTTEVKPDSENCNEKENNPETKETVSANEQVEPENKPSDADETCTPGESYKHHCNVCTCPSSGKKSSDACTLALCGDDN